MLGVSERGVLKFILNFMLKKIKFECVHGIIVVQDKNKLRFLATIKMNTHLLISGEKCYICCSNINYEEGPL